MREFVLCFPFWVMTVYSGRSAVGRVSILTAQLRIQRLNEKKRAFSVHRECEFEHKGMFVLGWQ